MRRMMNITVLFLAMLWTGTGCMGHARDESGKNGNGLAPCPDSPNCVSTNSTDPKHAMAPLPCEGTKEESYNRLMAVLRSMKRCNIVAADPGRIHAEFYSAVFGFVDDVDFVFDDKDRLIRFRSASRTGYYDFGVNRKRMEEISHQYLNFDTKSE